MAGKEISGKGQGSANSELKKPNCSRIDMEGATINSGYHSGREKNREKNEKASSSDLEGCKGTDRSYNATSDTIDLAGHTLDGHTLDSGALSGSSVNKQRGTVDKENKGKSPTSSSVPNKLPHQGSNVSGTRGSFNAGSSAPLRNEATIKVACDASVPAVKGLNIIDTRESFEVKDQHSKIKKDGANINSDACAGIADAKKGKKTH